MGKKHYLGKRIHAFRMDNGMTQAQVAEILGVSLSTIERILAGAYCSDLTRAKIEKRIANFSTEREATAA